mmetsp:Transcript_67987/g.153787  ORF Transcript_67987/g.153787 Transcript_67987/m.153787 type:complete len:140 (+) Transcript_67987:70-489(+)
MALIAASATAAAAAAASLAILMGQRRRINELELVVSKLQDKAKQLETVPKMMSAKRRAGDEATQRQLGELSEKATEKDGALADLQEQMNAILEQLSTNEQDGTEAPSVDDVTEKLHALESRIGAVESRPTGCWASWKRS